MTSFGWGHDGIDGGKPSLKPRTRRDVGGLGQNITGIDGNGKRGDDRLGEDDVGVAVPSSMVHGREREWAKEV